MSYILSGAVTTDTTWRHWVKAGKELSDKPIVEQAKTKVARAN
jgi:hypothetical protein